MVRFCLAFLLLVSSASAQITSSVVKYSQVTGLKNPVVIGSSVFVDAIDGQVTTKPVAFILAKSESGAEIRVEASDQSRQSVALEKVEGGYLLSASGKTWVEIKEFVEFEIGGVKRRLLSDSKVLTVELGPPPPPPTPPSPPVPNDAFGNIGQRVASWTAGLPKRKEVAAVYRAAAVRLASDLQATVNVVSSDIVSQRSKALGNDYQLYSKFIESLNADLNSRWPMTKGTLADYCNAVAAGLEAQ